MKHRKKSNLLKRLSCAALALPGLIPDANAGRVDETYDVDMQYGHYEESGRMKVNTFESALSMPLGKAMTAMFNVVRDVVSGASPIYNAKDSKGNITQIISGASIKEERDAVSANIAYFLDQSSLNVGGGYSKEHDYISKYLNANWSMDFNKKHTTLNIGGSAAFDEIQPTNFNLDCGDKCTKNNQQLLVGVTQIIDKDALVQSNLTFSNSNGYLSDPYKKVIFYDANNQLTGIKTDRRPREKRQWAWLTRYVQHFEETNHGALHADYRFTHDDWGINSHTFEASWHQPIGEGWEIIPRVRYYSQNKADFYDATFMNTSNNPYYSSDYRLAGFGVLSGGLKVSKTLSTSKPLQHLKFQAGVEYFDHQSRYELGGNRDGSFADFKYYLFTASVNLKF